MNPMNHIGLVRREVRRWQWSFNAVISQESLEQEGLIGVMRALESFDPELGKFSTHACPWIRHFIQKEVYRHVRTVKYPMNLAKKRYKEGRPIPLIMVSLDAPLDAASAQSGTRANERMFSVDPDGPSECEAADRRERIAHLLSTLPARDSELLRMRFYEEKTLQECGKHFGVSRERARQIEAEALEALADGLAAAE